MADELVATAGGAGTRPPRAVVADIIATGRPAFVYVLVAGLVAVLPALMVPLLIRQFVNRYLVAGDQSAAGLVVAGLVAAAAVSATLVGLQYAVLRKLVLRLSRTGQAGFVWRVLHIRIPVLQGFGAGDLVARITARQRFSYQSGMVLPLAVVSAAHGIAYAAILVVLDPLIGVTALGACLVTAAGCRRALGRRRTAQHAADHDAVALSSTTSEVVAAAESIKAAGWEQFAFARWERARRAAARSRSRLGAAGQLVSLVPVLGVGLGLGVVLAVGVLQILRGDVTLGTLVAAQAYVVGLLGSLGALIAAEALVQTAVSAARQTDVILSEPLDPEVLDPVGSALGRLDGRVELRDITFGYDPDRDPLIRGLFLDIPAGARVAFVGSSGSGKSTLIKIVVGEVQPWSGVVALDGIPRLQVPRAVRCRDVAYVPQTSVFFPGTIRDNLTLWDESVTDDMIRQAAQDACIDAAILSRPGSYFHEMGTGQTGFSGGELQRLAIARALVHDPRVLVLDEATSALDPVVEAEIEARLRRRGCTCLVVAHRLSTIRDADEIVVIDAGRVVQRGRLADIADHGILGDLLNA